MRKNNFINMARLLIAVALMSFSQLSGASTQPLQVGDKAPSLTSRERMAVLMRYPCRTTPIRHGQFLHGSLKLIQAVAP